MVLTHVQLIRLITLPYTKEAANLRLGTLKAVGAGAGLGAGLGAAHAAWKGEELGEGAARGGLLGAVGMGVGRHNVNKVMQSGLDRRVRDAAIDVAGAGGRSLDNVLSASPQYATKVTQKAVDNSLGGLMDPALLAAREGAEMGRIGARSRSGERALADFLAKNPGGVASPAP